ncbi:hypothetical protein HDV00_010393, partial [Rhizophlyctis rosea]
MRPAPRRRTLGAPSERSFGRSFFGWGGGSSNAPEPEGIAALMRSSMTFVAPALGAQLPTPAQLPQVVVMDYSQQ